MADATSSTAFADDDVVDADFVHRLVRGSELLQSGDPAGARALLEQALRLQPENERGQNLLALSYFKLGLFSRAEELYRALVADHPNDATLRMNLGLVLLKSGRTDDAVRSFQSALDADPSHRKTANYLGLVYWQRKDHGRAKEYFDLAQNAQMSARAALAMANTAAGPASDPSSALVDAPEMTFTPGDTTTERTGPWLKVRENASDAPAPTPEITVFTGAARLEVPQGTPFTITPQVVSIEVKGEAYARLEGLLATFGALECRAAFKKFRGRVTDKPFGEPSRRMMHVSGTGRLWFNPGERNFFALEIGEEPAFFREDLVFAFEETLVFENGRVPSKLGADLQLVHLRGGGRVLITSKRRPRSVEVVRDEPVRVPIESLVGWHGNVAPRIVALGEDGGEGVAVATVELTGEGRVILDAID